MASQAIEILYPAWLTPSPPPSPEPNSVCLGLVSFFQLLTIVNLLAPESLVSFSISLAHCCIVLTPLSNIRSKFKESEGRSGGGRTVKAEGKGKLQLGWDVKCERRIKEKKTSLNNVSGKMLTVKIYIVCFQ